MLCKGMSQFSFSTKCILDWSGVRKGSDSLKPVILDPQYQADMWKEGVLHADRI